MQHLSDIRKHLEIANYPPPFDGWGTHTRFVVEEIRRRGNICKVLKINENRQIKSDEYVDVQGGLDYLLKVVRFALLGYSSNVHVNAESPKGYVLALIAVCVGRICFRKATVTFHGGLPQSNFPAKRTNAWYWLFRALFTLASGVLCDSDDIKSAIEGYGVPAGKIGTAAGFSARNLHYVPVEPAAATQAFLANHDPIFFCYVSFRPEYYLDVLRAGMAKFRVTYPRAGFIWLGFPKNEIDAARSYVAGFSSDEQESLHMLGTLTHDEFLTLLMRCSAKLRTPACDGVSASVLESLALGVPVVASENGRRPSSVITYDEQDPADMCRKLEYLIQHRSEVIDQLRLEPTPDNVALTVDWLIGEASKPAARA